jgi:vacuolar-type H+-ATPase subunit F/Vma7
VTGVAAIGTADLVAGFGLAGAQVLPAEDREAVLAAWRGLPPDTAVVVLTEAAAETLRGELGGDHTRPGAPLTVVLPR